MEQKKYFDQTCQDVETTEAFRQLHTKLVEEVIRFCHDNHIDANEFYLHADCLRESIKSAKWLPYTDSGFSIWHDDGRTDEEPILFSM